MEYVPQEWHDEDASTPGSAARFAHIEAGILATRAWSSAPGNQALGEGALKSLTAGEENTALGAAAMENADLCSGNTATGSGAMQNNGSHADFNTGTGVNALQQNGGSENDAHGHGALRNLESGNGNAAFGFNAGHELEHGSGNLFLGHEAGAHIGGTENNRFVIANNPTTALIEGVLSGTQELGFFGVTPVTRRKLNPATATAKTITEALVSLGLAE